MTDAQVRAIATLRRQYAHVIAARPHADWSDAALLQLVPAQIDLLVAHERTVFAYQAPMVAHLYLGA